MANNTKLTGGVFYSILIDGKLSGHRMGNTNPDLLADLINFFDDKYTLKDQSGNTISKYCAKYRDGKKTNGVGLPFDQKHLTSTFHEKLQSNYGLYRSKMNLFVKTHMEKSSDAETVKSLLCCLESDGSIADGQQFLASYDGSPLTKKELLQQSVVCFETLLLGIWDFIITARPMEVGLREKGSFRDIEVRRFDNWDTTVSNNTIPAIDEEFSFSPWDQSGFELNEWNEELILNIDKHRCLYVHTKAIDDILNHLKQTRVVILTGGPGSGKTFATEIVAYHFMCKGVEVISSFDYKDAESILDLVRENNEKTQLFLIDDCMGQAYFDLNEDQETALRKLLSAISLCKNKYLLLNSRITIFNKAKTGESSLARRLKDQANNCLSLNKPSESERATIYFKHLLYSNPITNDHYLNLQPKKRYLNIINHDNYTPRIMEYVTSDLFLHGTSSSDYYKNVMATLANPAKIWDDEFNNKLEKKDRLLLITLFSLSDEKSRLETCRLAYEKRLSIETDTDTTRNNFEEAIRVLNGSMVECFSVDGKKFIAVANPSVNDYLSANILKRSSAEWKSIASSVVTIQQVVRLNVTNKERDRLIASFGRNETILDLIYESEEQKSFFVALSVIMTGELKQAYAEHIRQCFKSSRCDCPGWRFSFQWQNRESICEKVVMDKRLREFYLPGKQLAQYVNELLFNCSRYDMVRLLESFCSLSKDLYDPNDPVNKKAIESAIDAMIDDYAGDRWEKISSFASKDDYEPERIAEIINQDILDDLMYRAPDSKSVPDFICNYYDEQINSREYCTEDEVEEELKRLEDEPEESFDDFYSYSGPDSIAEMFERPSLK